VGESESTRKDDFKLFYVFHNAHSAYRNLWPVGMRMLKLRLIWWENDATVQTEIILYCEKTIQSGSYATIVLVAVFCALSQ